jgi:ferredoxin-NADP reductase
MTFRFSTEGTEFHYLSAQAVRVALPGVEDPWGPARTFSLSSSPSEKGLLSVTCRISETPFKQAFARLQPGDTAEIFGPLGLFPIDLSRSSLFLAAGIGITPFRGMLRYSADLDDPFDRRLLYVARTPEELVFKDQLDALSTSFPRLQVEYAVTRSGESGADWKGRVGRIDESWIREAAARLDRPKFYVAGRPEMVEPTVAILANSIGVPEDDIDYEVFRGF